MLPILKRRVRSKSEPGTYHIVELYWDGHLECDCIAGRMNSICDHQKRFAEWILNNGKNTKVDRKDFVGKKIEKKKDEKFIPQKIENEGFSVKVDKEVEISKEEVAEIMDDKSDDEINVEDIPF
jgi:hypothetical protein